MAKPDTRERESKRKSGITCDETAWNQRQRSADECKWVSYFTDQGRNGIRHSSESTDDERNETASFVRYIVVCDCDWKTSNDVSEQSEGTHYCALSYRIRYVQTIENTVRPLNERNNTTNNCKNFGFSNTATTIHFVVGPSARYYEPDNVGSSFSLVSSRI